MPRGGNTFDKYESKRRTDGRLVLENQTDELICNLIVNGEPDEQIILLLDEQEIQCTPNQIEAVKTSPLSARRISWLKKIKARDEYTPETPDECLSYVKKRLVYIDKCSDTEMKDKIAALSQLAKVAIDERKNKPAAPAEQPQKNMALEKLNQLAGTGEDDGSGS
jgi:hypothetical protein